MRKTTNTLIIVLFTIISNNVFAADDDPLFRFNGFDYSEAEITPELRNAIYRLEQEHYEKMQKLIEAAVLDIYLRDEAERKNVAVEALAMQIMSVEPPSKEQIEAFYKQNKQRINAPLQQVQGQIAQYLMGQSQQKKQIEIIADIKSKHELNILLTKPVPPAVDIAADGYPIKGNPEAKITVVEFADYQCPHCKDATSVVKKILAKYPDQIKVVFMDMPINRSGISRLVAEGAVCADQQGQFWAYHDAAFEDQRGLNKNSAMTLAKQLGLDEATFAACLKNPATKAKVTKAKAEGDRIGVGGTPTFFVNGELLNTDNLEVGLSDAIEQALQNSGS